MTNINNIPVNVPAPYCENTWCGNRVSEAHMKICNPCFMELNGPTKILTVNSPVVSDLYMPGVDVDELYDRVQEGDKQAKTAMTFRAASLRGLQDNGAHDLRMSHLDLAEVVKRAVDGRQAAITALVFRGVPTKDLLPSVTPAIS